MEPNDFRKQVSVFSTTTDSQLHHESIMAMLDPFDLDIEYKKLIVGTNRFERIRSIFSSFADTEDEEMLGELERESIEQVGILTNEYFIKKRFFGICTDALCFNN